MDRFDTPTGIGQSQSPDVLAAWAFRSCQDKLVGKSDQKKKQKTIPLVEEGGRGEERVDHVDLLK